MLAVRNTSPVFNLACIERLTLLHDQFDTIWIPSAVEAELRSVPDATVLKIIEQAKQAGWLKAQAASNADLISLLSVEVHQGEAEAIALAATRPASTVSSGVGVESNSPLPL